MIFIHTNTIFVKPETRNYKLDNGLITTRECATRKLLLNGLLLIYQVPLNSIAYYSIADESMLVRAPFWN